MKKSLLIALAVTFAVSVNAQRRIMNPATKLSAPNKFLSEQGQTNPATYVPKALLNTRRSFSGTNHVNSTVIPIGTNPNAFSCANNSRSNLWYDSLINTVTFIHRSTLANQSYIGNYMYDVSFDGGNNWFSDQGPVYVDPTASTTQLYRGRYPLTATYNPAGNTDPANAFLVYAGPWTSGGGWNGEVHGNANFNGSPAPIQYIDNHDTDSTYICFPENMFIVKNTNDLWKIGEMFEHSSTNTFLDSILMVHGVWNVAMNEYEFEYRHFPVHTNPANHSIVDMDIAFNDAGTTGYMAMIMNNDPDFFIYPDSILYLSVWKTTDGGITWDSATNTSCFHNNIINLTSPGINALLANDSTLSYGCTFDLDIVVDANSNLHILTGVAVSAGFSVFTGDSLWAMFDIFTEDQGISWKAQLLDRPMTFRGDFGSGSTADPTLAEDVRPFCSRNWDGTKLFFSWFDTDTLTFGTVAGGHNNVQPDLHTIGYDIVTQQWAGPFNMTTGSNADGICTFGNGGYYAIDSVYGVVTNVFNIPMVYQTLPSITVTGSPTSLSYVDDAVIDMNVLHPLVPVSLTCAPTAVRPVKNNSSFEVSANYPNPFTGKTNFDISLSKASTVTIEITGMLGQSMSATTYSNLSAGFHKLSVDCSKLSSGIYFYTVKAGADKVTRKMIVE